MSGQNSTEWKIYLNAFNITDIADAGDYLWLTNGKGVIKFDKITEVAVYYGFDDIEKSPDFLITSIVCDENGLPYVGATYTGILKMNKDEKWILLPPVNAQQLQSWGSVILLITDNEVVWTTISSLSVPQPTLARYQANAVDTFTVVNRISSLAEDKEGNLWIGKWDGGLFLQGHDHYETIVKYDGENWTTINSPSELGPPPARFSDINFDELGNTWMVGHYGLLDNGENKLVKFNDSKWQVYDLPVKTWITSLALQADSIIWLGTTNGLMKFSDSQWEVFDTENSELPANDINSVVVDDNGTKWLATDKGLVAFNDNGFILSVGIDSKMKDEIDLFPNPANDYITIRLPKELQSTTAEILNIQGKTIKTFGINNTQKRLDIAHFPAGVYMIRIQSEENQILKKFVKQ